MLLSEQDIEKFYPSKTDQVKNNINTIRYLDKMFGSKNILFVGVNYQNDWLLKDAKGILKLLEQQPSSDVKRYALLSKDLDTELYHIQTITDAQEDDTAILEKLSELIQNKQAYSRDSCSENINEELVLQKQYDILKYFGLFYNRHPQKFFMHMNKQNSINSTYDAYDAEYTALKRDVFGFKNDTDDSREWSRKNIRQLAIVANNFSDFYDLRDAINLMKTTETEPIETTLLNLLSSRFSEKSLLLYQILERYESGFPIGFLQLLPRKKYSLKAWRRAGIQLANSGAYIQRQGKQRLYERLNYADCVMRTAGKSSFQARICNEINEIPYQSMYGYLYPFHKVEIQGSEKIKDHEINEHFTAMFRTLYDILRDKSEEYHQIHSLLQTEFSSIIKMTSTLQDEKLEWKPGLLYCLLRESRMSTNDEELLKYCSILEEQYKNLDSHDNVNPTWRLFGEELMLHLSKALIMSQSDDEDKQLEAANECSKVEKAVLDMEKSQTIWKGEIPRQIFEHRIYSHFLCGMIYGRMSTIQEIARCRTKSAECANQKRLLEEMKDHLNYAEELIMQREHILGEQYRSLRSELARLMGEYYFKMSQYCGENRRFSDKTEWSVEENYYKKSEKAYMIALEFYNRNPIQNSVQCADIMRNKADMYCQWARSINETLSENQYKNKIYNELIEHCYENLINAYVIYRRYFNIRGIADVLQSIGQAESYNKIEYTNQNHRSHSCYYKTAMDMYQHLGDTWSSYVVSNFLSGCLQEIRSFD